MIVSGEDGGFVEWIRISQNKLKLMLTAEDVRRYALSADAEPGETMPDKSAFRAILTDVRGICGFDATEDKVYIQMYPSKGGGCELFVTRMGLLTVKEAVPALPVRRRAEPAAFCFEETDHLLAVCRILHARGFRGKSAAWQDGDGRLWLVLTGGGERSAFDFIGEYGRRRPAADVLPFLPEHGVAICRERAVETLAAI